MALITAFASNEDVFLSPLFRDAYILIPTVIWWIFFHVAMYYLIPRVVPLFHRLSASEQQDFVVRVVSTANGLILCTCSPLFINNFLANGILGGSLYTEIPAYRPYRAAVVGYFFWDVLTCFYFRWGVEWKIHGVCSLVGSYFLMYPLMDDLGTYYCGLFEGTNAFLHISVMLRMVGSVCHENVKREKALQDRVNRWATVMEYVFALLFTILRVGMGSLVGYCSVTRLSRVLYADYIAAPLHSQPPQCHNALVVVVCLVAVSSIHALQYMWFVMIVKKGLGLSDDAATIADEEKKKKK